MRVGEGNGLMVEAKLANIVAKAKTSLQHTSSPCISEPFPCLLYTQSLAIHTIRIPVNCGVDRQKMINDIYAGRGTPPSTFIMGSYSDADDKDSVRSPNKHKEVGEKSRRGRGKRTDGIRVKDGG